jgi:tetratricopeptide (TPR) repeat protein
LLSGLAALRFSSYAHAQEPDEDDPTALRMARQRFQEGVKYFDRGQYSKARAAFLQAYALKKHPSVLLNLAQSELRAGYEAEAANHFAQYLRETDGSNSAQVSKAQSGLETAKAKVGSLTLAADVDDAYVLVDGKLAGRTPLPGPLYLSPGTHMVGVRLGGKSVTRQITAVPGESITEMVNVTAAGSARPESAAPSEAEEEGATEEEVEETVAYEGAGREPFFRWLTRKPGALIGAGATVLFGVGAGVFAVSWQTNESAAKDTRSNILDQAERDGVDAPCTTVPDDEYKRACDDYVAYKDTADKHRLIALTSGVVAGLAATATVVGYFLDAEVGTGQAGRARRQPRWAVVPTATPDEAGLVVVGRF